MSPLFALIVTICVAGTEECITPPAEMFFKTEAVCNFHLPTVGTEVVDPEHPTVKLRVEDAKCVKEQPA